jgi:hypothetical protein
MSRKGKQARQRVLIAPDGRKILNEHDFRLAIAERLSKRALEIARERDLQSSSRLLGSVPLTIKACKTTAKPPDYSGEISKAIEITASLPYSKTALALLTDHMQETIVADLNPKQLLMNLKSNRGDGKIGYYDMPDVVQAEAMAAVNEDQDIKAALDDLCVCGHTRREHMNEAEDGSGEPLGYVDMLDCNYGCKGEDEHCRCRAFTPLPPGEKPTPMMLDDIEAGDADEGGDDE